VEKIRRHRQGGSMERFPYDTSGLLNLKDKMLSTGQGVCTSAAALCSENQFAPCVEKD
jgi:hypothetical protein